MQEIRLKTDRRTQLVDITKRVQEALDTTNGAAAALVYVPHTTAGVTINEHADPAVARDFETALERIVSEDWPWEHIEEGEENAPTHIRAAFMGSDVLVPIRDGALALGTWQGIFLCEFDGPRERSVYVTALAAYDSDFNEVLVRLEYFGENGAKNRLVVKADGTTYSFKDVDAFVVTSWADQGFSDKFREISREIEAHCATAGGHYETSAFARPGARARRSARRQGRDTRRAARA